MTTFVVVGVAQRVTTAVGALRHEGFDGRIVLIGAEPLPPYERPLLSKEYLRGEQPFHAAHQGTGSARSEEARRPGVRPADARGEGVVTNASAGGR
jgi:NADPH-dependent 2,4-dienoyl-CoA reductase/sulfur reductase-like enzyme